MNPASRNRVLMIGGSLILVALLLICGPLKDQFGQGTSEPPSVAAGPTPPVVAVDEAVDGSVDESLTGALAGGALGANGPPVAEEEAVDLVAAAPVPVVVPQATPKSAPKAAPRPKAKLPAVSAPPVVAAIPVGPSAQELAANAQNAFDASRPTGIAGSPVDRFAPPVDSGPAPSALALAASPGFSTGAASPIRACDTPGAGCQNTLPRILAGIPPVAGGNPRGGR